MRGRGEGVAEGSNDVVDRAECKAGGAEGSQVKAAGTHNDAGRPGVEEEHGAHQEGAGQHHADGQQEPVPQADVLLPEEEGVSVGVVEHALAAELLADGPHALDGLHEVAGLAEAVQVEGELGELQRLGGRDCAGTRGEM